MQKTAAPAIATRSLRSHRGHPSTGRNCKMNRAHNRSSAPTTATAKDFSTPVPEARGLTAYMNGAQVLVRKDNLPLLGYRPAV